MSKIQTITKNKNPPLDPCGHYVLIRPDDVVRKTESGIITGTADEHSREGTAKVEGTLVAVGYNAWKDIGDGRAWAEVGDKVFFKRHVSDRIEDKNDIIDGHPQIFFLLTDLDVLGVINE